MKKSELTYKALEILSDIDIDSILNSNKIDELIRLPLSVGMNHPDWKFAQDLCVKLYSHDDWRVKANALSGLELIAMSKGKLEKHIIKPILMNALKSKDFENLDIIHITNRINGRMNWKIGVKAIERLNKISKI